MSNVFNKAVNSSKKYGHMPAMRQKTSVKVKRDEQSVSLESLPEEDI